MKKLTLLLLIILSQSGYGQFWHTKEKLYGDKNIVAETRRMSSYDKISVSGPYRVKIVPGDSRKIKVTADANLMQAIDIFVKSGRLVIRTHPDFSIKKYSRLDIEVPADYLSDIKLTGSGDIYNTYVFDWNNLKLSITGSGDMDIKADTKHITASLTGSGEIKLQGKTENIKINITGSGDIDAKNLEANDANVQVTGSGNVHIKALQNLTINLLGTGNAYYYGEPEYLKTKSLGSGEVIFKEL